MFLFALGGVAIACSEVTAPPEPGTLTIALTTPHADDAAILIRVSGPTTVAELTPATDAYVLHERAGQDGTRVVAFGSLATGALATFEVPDVRRAAEYTATVLEVSGADNALRSDLGAHRLTVVR